MTVVNYLMKKHKVMSCVFEELYKFYGQPAWLSHPKDGQDPASIVDHWIKELGDYDDNLLKRACKSIYANDRVSRFPSLAHVLSELKHLKQARQGEDASPTRQILNIEQAFMERDKKLGKPFYILPRYRRAIDYVLDTLLRREIGDSEYAALGRERPNDQLRSAKYRLSEEKGLFENFDEILEKIYELEGE